MDSMTLTYFLIALTIGIILFGLVYKGIQMMILKEAREEAGEILKESQDQFQLDEDERTEITQEIELESWGKFEENHLLIEGKCSDLELQIA